MSPDKRRAQVNLGKEHHPHRPAHTTNRCSSFVWTPDRPSPQRARDINTNFAVVTIHQGGHGLPLAGSISANIRAGEMGRAHRSPVARFRNQSLNNQSQQLMASSSSNRMRSSPSNKQANKKRKKCGRCKHPLDHKRKTDASVVNRNAEDIEEAAVGDDVREQVDVTDSGASQICQCHEREQREMESRRNFWVVGEDPHATNDEEELLSWLHDWCFQFEEY